MCLGYITATHFFFFWSLVWFLRDGASAVMFWSFWQFEKAPECKQEHHVWYEGFSFFSFFFDVRLLMQTHIPAVCKSFYPHVIITHEEFDIHLRKVAEKGRLGLAQKKMKRLINRTRSSIRSLPQSRSWFGWKELEIHCPRPKIMVNRSSAFPVVSAADPWRLGSDWCLIVLCCCSSFSSSVARKCRGNWAIISDLST